jgi:regulator of protease activity HflC (stomatin/prohibitin superfamily)
MIREKQRSVNSGWGVLGVLLAIDAAALYGIYLSVEANYPPGIITSVAVAVLASLMFPGMFIVNPNEGKVLQLFGAYRGTVREAGLRWANPLYSKKRVSLRIRNFESAKLKVNDNEGNPIEIAAVVVWRVVDTAEAVFEVHDYENYLHVQTESAVRNLASSYTYDTHDEEHISLRGHTGAVAEHLKREIQDRLSKAGIEVMEARITHLAYAPEIAAAMLQRQQAGAIIAARSRIVEGAVGMVQMALDMLSQRSIVQLDDERKAAMVSNLLVVLCGERGTQPVVNAGTIYQ